MPPPPIPLHPPHRESEDHDRFSTSALCHELLHPIALWNAGVPLDAFDFNDHPEKSANFDSFPSNRLGADSECAARRAQAFWCFLITLAFAVIMFLTAWHGPDCRSPSGQSRLGVRS